MKTSYSIIISTLMVVMFFSCGNSTDNKAYIDSLETTLAQRNADYQQLDEYLTVISASLDSIARQESAIFDSGKESPAANPEQIKKELEDFQQTLKAQRERIGQLEQQLKNEKSGNKKLQGIVSLLNAQMAEKETQIAKLKEEVNDKNMSIAQLKQHLDALAYKTIMQSETIASQNKQLANKDNIINQAFVKIASKSELKEAGLLTSGFLKKSKVDYSQVDTRQFFTIDTRKVTEFEINSKSPKILTEVPSDSYTLDRKGEKTVLHITNPRRFWSVSKFLIIQI